MRDIDEAGHDLRVWCYGCSVGREVDGQIWFAFQERGWSIDLEEARSRFRCRRCRTSAHVLLVPATRPEQLLWEASVVKFFHHSRSQAKKLRRVH